MPGSPAGSFDLKYLAGHQLQTMQQSLFLFFYVCLSLTIAVDGRDFHSLKRTQTLSDMSLFENGIQNSTNIRVPNPVSSGWPTFVSHATDPQENQAEI